MSWKNFYIKNLKCIYKYVQITRGIQYTPREQKQRWMKLESESKIQK